MKITKLSVENFLGISRVDVSLDTPVTLFAGFNGHGKSSIQEAIRVAITQDTVRGVTLKKNYAELVKEGHKAGGAVVTINNDPERSFAFNMPAGSFSGPSISDAMRVALDGQRFSSMTPDERRTFLFDLTKCKPNTENVKERMLAKGCGSDNVEEVLPLLRTGFPGVCEYAKNKATESKGAWRALTGETYGSKKADGWKAEKPIPNINISVEDILSLKPDIELRERKVSEYSIELGQSMSEHKKAIDNIKKRNELHAKALLLKRTEENLDRANIDLAEYEKKVIETRERAAGTVRVGLIHDMALFAKEVPIHQKDLERWETVADALLERYESEFGKIPENKTVDQAAKDALPEQEKALNVLRNAEANLRRDLNACVTARAQYDAIGEIPDIEKLLKEIHDIQLNIKLEKENIEDLQVTLSESQAIEKALSEADTKTKKAAEHHSDVLAWTSVADAVSPSGIPAELLAEALAPVNLTLDISAIDTGWMKVTINADMSIKAGGRQYALLSESEKWRTDAMIAHSVAKISGLKILLLDRMDVLDMQGRVQVLEWLDNLAHDGLIDTAILFATLKAPPSGLPDSITAHWVENGSIKEFKEAA